jgi:hypothetical protein
VKLPDGTPGRVMAFSGERAVVLRDDNGQSEVVQRGTLLHEGQRRPKSEAQKLGEALGDKQRMEDAVRAVADRVKLPPGVKVGQVAAHGDGWHVDFRDDDDKVVAAFDRSVYDIRGKLIVRHSTAKVEEPWQGKGIATAVNNEFEYWYSDSGVDEITLTASGGGPTNGGYTWARAGYDWDPNNSADHIRGVIRDMQKRAEDEELSRVAEQWVSQINAAPHRPERWPAPAQLAAFGYKPGAKTWIGKEVMRQESWAGRKRPKTRPSETS